MAWINIHRFHVTCDQAFFFREASDSGEKNKQIIIQVRFHGVKCLITADQFHGVKISTLNFTALKFTPINFLHYQVSRRESFH